MAAVATEHVSLKQNGLKLLGSLITFASNFVFSDQRNFELVMAAITSLSQSEDSTTRDLALHLSQALAV